jgi:hypothetical protein
MFLVAHLPLPLARALIDFRYHRRKHVRPR